MKGTVREKSSPISDHESSSTAFFALLFPSPDCGGSDHLSTRRKLNLRRVPPGVDPATRSAAMKYPCPTRVVLQRRNEDRQTNDNPRQLKLLGICRYLATGRKNQTSRMEGRLVFTNPRLRRVLPKLALSAVPIPERGSIDPIPIQRSSGARLLLHVWNGASLPSSQSPVCRDVSRTTQRVGAGGGQIGRSADLIRGF